MTEYIERKAAIEAAAKDLSFKREHGFNAGCARAANNIRRVPAADVKPVVRGKWIKRDDSIYAECPNCRCEVTQLKSSVFRDGKGHIDYCPNCGADMKGEIER